MSDAPAPVAGTVLPASGHRHYVWRNGLGSAMEIAAGPVEPATGSAGWTVSIATIETDVAFSSFPGVDRRLMALSDGGLRLVVDGQVREVSRWAVASFDGASDVASSGVDQPTLDLNLMVSRAQYLGSLAARSVVGTATVTPRPGSETFVVLLEGALTLGGSGVDGSGVDEPGLDGQALTVHDTVRLGSDRLTLTGNATIAVARISPRR